MNGVINPQNFTLSCVPSRVVGPVELFQWAALTGQRQNPVAISWEEGFLVIAPTGNISTRSREEGVSDETRFLERMVVEGMVPWPTRPGEPADHGHHAHARLAN